MDRVLAAARRRTHGGAGASTSEAPLNALTATVARLGQDVADLRSELADARHHLSRLARGAVEDDTWVRHELRRLRSHPAYEAAYAEPEPLVSILIPTLDRAEMLATRSVPSALAQDHPSVEVIVVGDAAPPAVGEALAGLGDPRVRYENLPMRGYYPEERIARWHVAGTAPMNRALELARGSWIAFVNDDDALRPHHISTLLRHAVATRAEVTFGQLEQHGPDGVTPRPPCWPDTDAFGWQMALQHRDVSFIDFSLAAADHGVPGDWFRARRMLRAGVRFSAIDEVVVDYYPNTLWPDA